MSNSAAIRLALSHASSALLFANSPDDFISASVYIRILSLGSIDSLKASSELWIDAASIFAEYSLD